MILIESNSGPPPFRTIQPFVLASSSPRRRELLALMGLTFETVVSGVDETVCGLSELPEELVLRCAREKAEAVCELYPNAWVLGADTVVALGGRIFGKPADFREAVRMLGELSGKVHGVISGFCLVNRSRQYFGIRSVVTKVRFKDLTEAEIRAYAESAEPLDKAGAYGIQGMGAFLVASIEGSYTNVVGLPLSETLEMLMQYGVVAPAAEHRS